MASNVILSHGSHHQDRGAVPPLLSPVTVGPTNPHHEGTMVNPPNQLPDDLVSTSDLAIVVPKDLTKQNIGSSKDKEIVGKCQEIADAAKLNNIRTMLDKDQRVTTRSMLRVSSTGVKQESFPPSC